MLFLVDFLLQCILQPVSAGFAACWAYIFRLRIETETLCEEIIFQLIGIIYNTPTPLHLYVCARKEKEVKVEIKTTQIL